MKEEVSHAARSLRHVIGDTQQQFANRLQLSISSVVRYEAGSVPEPHILMRLIGEAHKHSLTDLADVLQGSLTQQIGAVALESVQGIQMDILRARAVLMELRSVLSEEQKVALGVGADALLSSTKKRIDDLAVKADALLSGAHGRIEAMNAWHEPHPNA